MYCSCVSFTLWPFSLGRFQVKLTAKLGTADSECLTGVFWSDDLFNIELSTTISIHRSSRIGLGYCVLVRRMIFVNVNIFMLTVCFHSTYIFQSDVHVKVKRN